MCSEEGLTMSVLLTRRFKFVFFIFSNSNIHLHLFNRQFCTYFSKSNKRFNISHWGRRLLRLRLRLKHFHFISRLFCFFLETNTWQKKIGKIFRNRFKNCTFVNKCNKKKFNEMTLPVFKISLFVFGVFFCFFEVQQQLNPPNTTPATRSIWHYGFLPGIYVRGEKKSSVKRSEVNMSLCHSSTCSYVDLKILLNCLLLLAHSPQITRYTTWPTVYIKMENKPTKPSDSGMNCTLVEIWSIINHLLVYSTL